MNNGHKRGRWERWDWESQPSMIAPDTVTVTSFTVPYHIARNVQLHTRLLAVLLLAWRLSLIALARGLRGFNRAFN